MPARVTTHRHRFGVSAFGPRDGGSDDRQVRTPDTGSLRPKFGRSSRLSKVAFWVMSIWLTASAVGCNLLRRSEGTVLLACEPTQWVIAPGGQAEGRCEVRSALGFQGDVRLQCAAPLGVTCRLQPSHVTVSRHQAVLIRLVVGVGIDRSPGEASLRIEAFPEDRSAVQQELRLFVAETAFTLECTPTSLVVVRGHGGFIQCFIGFFNNYKSPVYLACEGLPPGLVCNVPAQVIPREDWGERGGEVFSATLNVAPTARVGDYAFWVRAYNGPIQRRADIELRVRTGSFSLQCGSLSSEANCRVTTCQLTSHDYEGLVEIRITCLGYGCGSCRYDQCFAEPTSVGLTPGGSASIGVRLCPGTCGAELCARGGFLTQCVTLPGT